MTRAVATPGRSTPPWSGWPAASLCCWPGLTTTTSRPASQCPGAHRAPPHPGGQPSSSVAKRSTVRRPHACHRPVDRAPGAGSVVEGQPSGEDTTVGSRSGRREPVLGPPRRL